MFAKFHFHLLVIIDGQHPFFDSQDEQQYAIIPPNPSPLEQTVCGCNSYSISNSPMLKNIVKISSI